MMNLLFNTLEAFSIIGRYQRADAPTEWDPQHRRHIDIIRYLRLIGVKENAKVLDVGCGTALLGQRLRKEGFTHICGTDWRAPDQVPQLSSLTLYRQTNLNSDSIVAKFNDTFDLVIASDVMEHMENPADFLRKIREVCKVDGDIIITIPNAFNLIQRLYILLSGNTRRYHIEKKNEFGHISLFTSNILQSLLNRTHLKLVATSGGACFISRYCIFPKASFSTLWSYNVLCHLKVEEHGESH